MSKKWIVIIVGGLIVSLPVLFAIAKAVDNASMVEQVSKNEVMPPVPTVIAKASMSTTVRSFPGKVRAARRVDLAFDVSGMLVELNAQEGSVVEKGDVIAKIDSRELQNNYKASKATYDDTERVYKRAGVLRDKNIISQSEYDKAKADLQIAEAQLSVCKKNLDDSVLIAPFGGVIASRNVENHQRVTAHQTIVSLQDISREEVVIQLPEKLIAHGGVKSLRNIKVKFDVDESRWFKAELNEYRVQPDSCTRTYDAIISLYPPKHITILPGMTATVMVEQDVTSTGNDSTVQRKYKIPVEAIWSNGHKKSFVWVIPVAGGCPQKNEVIIESLEGQNAIITSGINDGDNIATAGVHSLMEHLAVRPMTVGKKGLDG